MDYLIIIDKFPTLIKKEINEGDIPKQSIEISSILHSIFLLSNQMRKDNNLNIICINHFDEPKNKTLLVQIKGNELRYLSPDERVTLLILQKIFMVVDGKSNKKIYRRTIQDFKIGNKVQTTPGIKIQKIDPMQYWNNIKYDNYIIIEESQIKFDSVLGSFKNINNESDLESLTTALEKQSKNSKKSLIIFNLSNENEILKYIFGEKTTIFHNKEFMSRFFSWDIINLIETLNEYL